MRAMKRFVLRSVALAIVLFTVKEVIAQGVAAGIKQARTK